MTEKPILFSGPMVRAILSGAKTQTRRLVKDCGVHVDTEWDMPPPVLTDDGWQFADGTTVKSRYAIGDRLYVREAWATALCFDLLPPRQIAASAEKAGYCPVAPQYPPSDLWYQADSLYRQWGSVYGIKGKWRPSIHMPRWASRLTLEVTGVRVERLRDISEADARAEGIVDGGCLTCGEPEPCNCWNPEPSAVDSFVWLWQSIHGPDSWHANPWVWVVEFRREKP